MIRRGRPPVQGTRVGLWGSGVMAASYAAAADALGWTVTAVASRRPDSAADLAGRLGATATTFERFPIGQLDVAIVATPPSDHARAVATLAGAGLPTLVCTPLSDTLADADDLVRIDAATGAPVTFGANLAVSPLVSGLLREVRSLGSLTSLVGRSARRAPTWGGFVNAAWGGGVLLHPGSQLLTPMLLTARLAGAGAPTTVSASFPSVRAVETHAEVAITFASGLVATATASWDRTDDLASWDLQASSDTAVVRADMDPRPTLERNGDEIPVPSGSVLPPIRPLADVGLLDQLRLVKRDADRGDTPALSVALGRSVLDVVMAASRSAGRHGEPVGLPYDGDRSSTPIRTYQAAVDG